MLEIENLAIRYRNGALGIEDVNLTVEPGQLVVLTGANGAGKTSTVRGVSGFVRTEGARVVQGQVRLGGKSIARLEPHRTHRLGVVVVPERTKVFASLTVAENLAAIGHLPPRPERQRRLDALLSLFPALTERMSTLAGRLSGGQQQMLAIGRALMADVKVLLVDEMTLGLHPSLHEPLFAAIRQTASGERAALVVDEDLTPAASLYADCHYHLESGVVVSATDLGQSSTGGAVPAMANEAVRP